VAGEAVVARWYEAAGYTVVDRNWRCREGELDLVLSRDRTVVFCEVKTRRSVAFGAPFEAVTVTKQRRLRTLALRWLAAHPDRRVSELRFDVASVLAEPGRQPVIDVIQAAF
jgi:putative endonuclease